MHGALIALVLAFVNLAVYTESRAGEAPGCRQVGENGEVLCLSTMPGMQVPEKIERAPDFELSASTGEKHLLSQYRGRVVMLSFWTTW